MRYLLGVAAMAMALQGSAAVKSETAVYKAGELEFRGYVAYDDARTGKRPVVLIVHEWWGLGEHVRKVADRLAQAGYVGFAVDMYGEGKLTKDPQEAARWAGAVRGNPSVAEERFRAALNHIRKHPLADTSRMAAIGYCFGGTVCLEMARLGVDLGGVVSFHGGLASQVPMERRKLTARVLVLHGADDPSVPAEQVKAFEDEMRAARADWQLVAYGNAVHSFTNPEANSPTARYDAKADRRSWEAMTAFLRELFEG
ncbi:MAG: dienelactone hydrolase family protein [Chthonomonadales bacterium]|nr:dienelactone hydrolase family protein [Chthonomonadales bacterium]